MELTSVPEPDPRLRAAAEALVGSVNDETVLERDPFLVRSLFGTGSLGAPVASTGSSATFEVVAERGKLDLAVSVDAEGRLLSATWTPRPLGPPLFDVR
jgi:hypothetical protein